MSSAIPRNVLLDGEVGRTTSDKRIGLATLRKPFDMRQWRQSSAAIRAFKELTRVQRKYEATVPTQGIILAPAIPPENREDEGPEIHGRISVDLEHDRVTLDNRTVTLTPREGAVLRVLANNAGRAVSTRQLLLEAWGPEYVSNADWVRVYITRLRKKLEPDPKDPTYIITHYGMGYRFRRSE